MVRPSGQRHREHEGAGRPIHTMSRELELLAGRLCDSPWLRRERKSVVVVWPAAPVMYLAGGTNATSDWYRHPPNFWRGGLLGRRQAATWGPYRYDADSIARSRRMQSTIPQSTD